MLMVKTFVLIERNELVRSENISLQSRDSILSG